MWGSTSLRYNPLLGIWWSRRAGQSPKPRIGTGPKSSAGQPIGEFLVSWVPVSMSEFPVRVVCICFLFFFSGGFPLLNKNQGFNSQTTNPNHRLGGHPYPNGCQKSRALFRACRWCQRHGEESLVRPEQSHGSQSKPGEVKVSKGQSLAINRRGRLLLLEPWFWVDYLVRVLIKGCSGRQLSRLQEEGPTLCGVLWCTAQVYAQSNQDLQSFRSLPGLPLVPDLQTIWASTVSLHPLKLF